MIRSIQIQNFKSITDLTLELGRVTVLIGANGSGKSNILEAIAFAGAAAANKLDNEFLAPRGIRVTEPQFMYSAFQKVCEGNFAQTEPIEPDKIVSSEVHSLWQEALHYLGVPITVSVKGDAQEDYQHEIIAADTGVWGTKEQLVVGEKLVSALSEEDFIDGKLNKPAIAKLVPILRGFLRQIKPSNLASFLIYAPENTALRSFREEGQILPLGIKGEGLFAHLKALNTEKYRDRLDKIREHLRLIEWFKDFAIPDDLMYGERTLRLRDKHLPADMLFDQRSANEGFLYLLFYLTLLISPDTPGFFAIDNIDNAMNPKLCIALVELITRLAAEHDKQVILTTHNPAVLDGLNLNDDNQRLLVVERTKAGPTRVRRVDAPQPQPGDAPISLSRAFMRGYIGGLPKNF